MKKLISLLLVLTLCVGFAVPASAAAPTGMPLQSELDWFGADDIHNILAGSINSYETGLAPFYHVIDNGDGTVSALVVYESFGMIRVESYDERGSVTFRKTIPMELPDFGAFLAGDDCFYIAYGQNNFEMIDSTETWRIVKYDANWNKVGAYSATGGETDTTMPFGGFVARMDLSDDGRTLALYAGREMYGTTVRHQANIAFLIDTETMTEETDMVFEPGMVSHSLGQFVRFDGDKIVTVDHGDSSPRSFFLQTGFNTLGASLFAFHGDKGDTATYAIGSGLEVSQDGYLFLFCSAPQDGSTGPWNVYLSFTEEAPPSEKPSLDELIAKYDDIIISTTRPETYGVMISAEVGDESYYFQPAYGLNFTDEMHLHIDDVMKVLESNAYGIPNFAVYPLIQMTDSTTDICCARLVKLSDSSLVVMWGTEEALYWQLINGRGERVGEEHVLAGVPMPPTEPIVVGDTIRWIQAENGLPSLYTLNVSTGKLEVPSWVDDGSDDPDDGGSGDTGDGGSGDTPTPDYPIVEDPLKYFNIVDGVLVDYSGYDPHVVIPNTVTAIGDNAFGGSMAPRANMISVTIPDSVTSIGAGAFFNCYSLTSVTIPASVTSIGDDAFGSCTALALVTLPATDITMGERVFDGTPWKTGSVSNEGDFVITNGVLTGYTGSGGNVIIPSSVTSIGEEAFKSCHDMTAVTIPASVTSIGRRAFAYCDGITELVIPNSVTSIGEGSFYGCTALTAVTLSESLTAIEKETFKACERITAITVPASVTVIGEQAFNACMDMTEITIPRAVTSIENGAFYSCYGLENVYYTGSEAEWSAITVAANNSPLNSAEIHYNYAPAQDEPSTEPTTPAEPLPEIVDALYADMNFVVNGETVSLEVYEINGNNYFKLRDLAMLVSGTEKQFNVFWDDAIRNIDLISNEAYAPVGGELAEGDGSNKIGKLNASPIFKDGRSVTLAAYTINGNNYFKLRDLCRAFDIGVTWNEATWTVGIDTSIGYTD